MSLSVESEPQAQTTHNAKDCVNVLTRYLRVCFTMLLKRTVYTGMGDEKGPFRSDRDPYIYLGNSHETFKIDR